MTVTDRLPLGGDEETELDPFLERAARWATELEYRDVPRPVRWAARAQLVSTVGAAVWTCSHPLGERISTASESHADGDATFLGGRDLSPEG
ncbi:MAG: hypothetical protein ACOCQM_07190, partial [Natronomonas sp.]